MRAKRPIVAVLIATATAAGGSTVATSEPPPEPFADAADLVIVNANIIAMADGQPRAGAGKIVFLDEPTAALGDREVELDELVTHHFDLDSINDAVDTMNRGTDARGVVLF